MGLTSLTVVSAQPSKIDVSLDGTIGEKMHDISTYFNPSSGKIQLKYRLSSNAHVSLEIYSILGEKILTLVDVGQTAGAYSYSIDKSKFPQSTGLYIVKFIVDGNVYTRRLGNY